MEILDLLTKYWSVIAFMGVVIISWVRYEGKNNSQDIELTNLSTRVTKLEANLETHVKSMDAFREEIKIGITEINTKLEYIAENISDLKTKRK